jgi:hypothetical protein
MKVDTHPLKATLVAMELLEQPLEAEVEVLAVLVAIAVLLELVETVELEPATQFQDHQ